MSVDYATNPLPQATASNRGELGTLMEAAVLGFCYRYGPVEHRDLIRRLEGTSAWWRFPRRVLLMFRGERALANLEQLGLVETTERPDGSEWHWPASVPAWRPNAS